jgi:glycerophosphoryl diester phosphodiesterase
MKAYVKWLVAGGGIVLALGLPTGGQGGDRRVDDRGGPIVIAHRGASGYVPEHTLAAYYIAVIQGADYVEPDLVITKDGVLVARHENEIGGTTNVGDIPKFASRRTTKTIDGEQITGWFTEDFTLDELKTLRAKERIPQQRPANTRFDGMFEVPTFEEVLTMVESVNEQRRRLAQGTERRSLKLLGIYPETKHPSYFQSIGLPLEEPLVRTLDRDGYRGPGDPVYIQSFEVANLRKLSKMTKVKLVQLIDGKGKPWDFVVSNDPRTYADLVTPDGLKEIARYASGIGANKSRMIPRVDDSLGTPSTLVRDAHEAGLLVHGWTFRAENAFLPRESRSGADRNANGDLPGEIRKFLELGMDGFFTDQPDIGAKVRDEFVR